MSLRRHVLRILALATASAMVFGAFAGTAGAKKMSKKQKAAITKKLRKQVKKNPRVIRKKSFLKQARLVDFKLPVVIRVRRALNSSGDLADNQAGLNTASLNLGPSLGSRTLGLGGHLPAEIEFADSYDGGGLGNVGLELKAGGEAQGFGLKSTSIPLLTNGDTTTQNYMNSTFASLAPFPNVGASIPVADGLGCNNWDTADVNFGGSGVDDPADLTTSYSDGENNLGAGPYSPEPGVGAGDTVLRTNSLNLAIANPGDNVTLPGGSEYVIGKSGGRANLFGNIPGKSYGIEVTASLATNINSILRETDASANGQTPLTYNIGPDGIPGTDDDTTDALTTGNKFVAFNCRQAISGSVPNWLAGIRLNGQVKVSPAITADGKLRIAKASLSLESPARLAVGACLVPYTSYAAFNPVFDPTQSGTPIVGGSPNPLASPVNPGASKPIQTGVPYTLPTFYGGGPISNARDASCGSIDPILQSFGVDFLPAPGTPFTTTDDGSQAKVEATLESLSLDADVLVGGGGAIIP